MKTLVEPLGGSKRSRQFIKLAIFSFVISVIAYLLGHSGFSEKFAQYMIGLSKVFGVIFVGNLILHFVFPISEKLKKVLNPPETDGKNKNE